MDPAWFRLAKNYPVNRGITLPFLLGALRQPPGLVRTAEESRAELGMLLTSMRDETPDGYQAIVSLCGGSGQLIVRIEPSGAEDTADTVVASPADPSRSIRIEPIYGLRVDDFESLVSEIWQRHGQAISEGKFSFSRREWKWLFFDGAELTNIARCLRSEDDGAA